LKKIDLDEIILTPTAFQAWEQKAAQAAQIMSLLGIPASSIPDEEAGILRNGNLKIYVKIPGGVEVSMEVPKEHWSYRMPKN
jgi:hypothetical protein